MSKDSCIMIQLFCWPLGGLSWSLLGALGDVKRQLYHDTAVLFAFEMAILEHLGGVGQVYITDPLELYTSVWPLGGLSWSLLGGLGPSWGQWGVVHSCLQKSGSCAGSVGATWGVSWGYPGAILRELGGGAQLPSKMR